MKASLQDSGQFHGMRLLIKPSNDGTTMGPVPVPQVGLLVEGDEEWTFFIERELTPDNLGRYRDSPSVQIKIFGVGAECDRLSERLVACGIAFEETHRV